MTDTNYKMLISADTNHVIGELRKRKEKWDRKKKQLDIMFYTFITFCFFGVYYILQSLLKLELFQPLELFSAFLNQKLALFTLLSLIGFKLYLNVLTKAEKEAEKKYENLRMEVIDYLQTSPHWLVNKDSAKKDQLTALLDQEGINLRHKTK